jgi:putative transposase
MFKNDVFELNGRQFVLLGVRGEPGAQIATIIEKHAKTAFPEDRPLAELDGVKLVNNKEERRKLTSAREHATEASKQRADVRWEQIKDIVNNPALLQEGPRWALVVEHAHKVRCAPNTIRTALRLWWQGGQTRDALLGYRSTPKRRDEPAAEDGDKEFKPCMRGRPSTKGIPNFRATRIDHEHFKDVIENVYLKDGRMSVTAAYHELQFRYYSRSDGNGQLFLRSPGEYPTLRQFKRYLEQNYTTEYRLRKRKGNKAFDRDHRAVLGTTDDICSRPGQIYEMDSTIVDLTVVSSEGREEIIGRPTLFIIVDRKSRLIVGWYVGLEKPSWDAALQAIFSIAEDKRAMCARLGLPYDPNDWPAVGILCEELLVDRGETVTRRANALVALGVDISHLPSCRPDWKPVVEGQFRITHQAISDQPGYNPASNALKRRSENFSDGAALTLQEAEKIIVRAFIAHNRTIRARYELTRDQIRDKVEPSPVNIFAHGVRTQSGSMRKCTEEELKLALLPAEDAATIDENGIWVNGMCYQPENGEHSDWFVEGRRSVGAVKVSYDRRRVDKIYVHDRGADDGYFLARLARHSVKYEGLSLAEAQWMQKQEEKLLANASHSKSEESTRFKADTRPILESAKRATAAATKGVSKTARRANTKTARETELNLERDDVAVPTGEPAASSTVPHSFPRTPPSSGAKISLFPVAKQEGTSISATRRARTQLLEGISV